MYNLSGALPRKEPVNILRNFQKPRNSYEDFYLSSTKIPRNFTCTIITQNVFHQTELRRIFLVFT